MKKLFYIVALIIVGTSCTNDDLIQPVETSTKDIQVPDGFDFSLTQNISLNITVKNQDFTLSGVPVKIYLTDPGSSEDPNLDAKPMRTLVSDKNGIIDDHLKVPKYLDKLFLVTNYLGLPNLVILPIEGEAINFTYGETTSIEPVYERKEGPILKSGYNIVPMGSWTSAGVPSYLEAERDQISQSLLDNINASLPENRRLTESHPDYLEAGNQANVVINETADIWVTFVHEGAGYLNTLGYYLYDQDNPPATASDLDQINIIYPNVSFNGSGGALSSGDKVYLGQFEAGQSIGWVLLANGYKYDGNFRTSNMFFSDRRFNPETTDEKRQHMVLLYDGENDLLLMGFEDLNRDGWTDEDFNDAIFYVTANPITAIELQEVPLIDTPDDTDDDGVSNTFDDYPNDPELAYNNHYPAEGQNGTIVGEDLWPSFGDFDFNDLVLEYHFHNMADPQNRVRKMIIDITVKAIGASFHNGFGIELPIAPSKVLSVSGIDNDFEFVQIAGNGTESDQPNTVIIFFEDAYNVLPYVGSSTGINTNMSEPKSDPQTLSVLIEFSSPISLSELGSEPYNPFIIINEERGKEIHLAGNKPTNLADQSYFGSNQDDTNAGSSKYYLSVSNLPWMLDIPDTFYYPQEKNDIILGYNYFSTWATSGGVLNNDWYTDKDGNRNLNKLYSK